MTDSSVTPITAASNGGTTTDSSPQDTPTSPAKPVRGIARLREHEVYHLMNLVQSALYEAEHLITEVLGQARHQWLERGLGAGVEQAHGRLVDVGGRQVGALVRLA